MCAKKKPMPSRAFRADRRGFGGKVIALQKGRNNVPERTSSPEGKKGRKRPEGFC